MRLTLVLLTLTAATAASALEDVDGSVAKLSEADRAALLETLDLALPDGPASRLRNVRPANSNPSDQRYCGMINVKNRFGAFTGYQSFMAIPKLKRVFLARDSVDDPYTPVFQISHDAVCK